MNIFLTPELDKLVQEKVNSGLYGSADEVVQDALHLLQSREALEKEKLISLQADIQQGVDDLDAGRYTIVDSGFVDMLVSE